MWASIQVHIYFCYIFNDIENVVKYTFMKNLKYKLEIVFKYFSTL